VEVAKGLWDGWADDAFLYDKKSGRYLDAGRFRTLDHDGEFFQVRGPLNVARPPQGHPVLFLAGQSEDGREMAAAQVDCVFASTSSIESSTAFSKDLRDRLDKYDRAPGSLKVFTPMTVYLGSSDAEAQELVDELASLISPELGVANLSKVVHMDLTAYPLDGPMPEPPADWDGIAGIRDTVLALAKKDNLTIRQTYERVMSGGGGGNTVIGSASTVADHLEEWDRSGASDGLMIGIPVVPKGLDDFVDQVVPELQRRGILRTEYTGSTLRENLELPAPPNRFFGK
jgi:alkanesulfonate monooxygenase